MRLSELRIALVLTLLSSLGLNAVPSHAGAPVPPQMRVENIPEIPTPLVEQLSRYRNARSCSFKGWLPRGRGMVVSTRFGETNQLHLVEMPGGARQQISFYHEPVGDAVVSPAVHGSSLVFTMDEGGSENYQLFHFDLASRSIRRLTSGQGRHGSVIWDHAGERIAYFSTERNGVDFDVRILSPRAVGEPHSILEDGGAWFPVDWSHDGRRLLVSRYVSVTQSEYWLVDTGSGDRQPLQSLGEEVAYGPARFDPRGEGLYFVSDQLDGTQRLFHLETPGGEPELLSKELDWDVEGLALSPDGKRVAFSINRSGASQLFLHDVEKGRQQPVDLPLGVLGDLEFDAAGRRLGFVLDTPDGPGDAYALEIDDKGRTQLVRWTSSEVGGLNPASFVEPSLIYYRTFDRNRAGAARTVPAYYYRPEGPGPHPVVVYIHGGPEGQTRPNFSSTIQSWVREFGIAVLAPNVRGSTGYGRNYALLDNGRLREDSVRDLGSLLDWIAVQSELDAGRVGVYGGSYGGYMVLASLVHFGERIRAAVDVVGISNFVTFLENTQSYRRDLRRAEYGDERDPEMRAFLESISPLARADQIRSPLLVAQGANDPRVPASEAEQIVAAVRERDVEVWYMVAGDEGHGFRKKTNRDYFSYATALFWQQYLLAPDAP